MDALDMLLETYIIANCFGVECIELLDGEKGSPIWRSDTCGKCQGMRLQCCSGNPTNAAAYTRAGTWNVDTAGAEGSLTHVIVGH